MGPKDRIVYADHLGPKDWTICVDQVVGHVDHHMCKSVSDAWQNTDNCPSRRITGKSVSSLEKSFNNF